MIREYISVHYNNQIWRTYLQKKKRLCPADQEAEDSAYEMASYQQGAKKRGYTKRPVTETRKETAVFGF